MAAKTEPKTTKYDGFLSRTATVESTAVDETPALEDKPSAPRPPAAAPARKAPAKASLAKTRDPNIKQYSILLNMDTHTDASFILTKQRTGEDMSDLVQRLLAEWVSKNRMKA